MGQGEERGKEGGEWLLEEEAVRVERGRGWAGERGGWGEVRAWWCVGGLVLPVFNCGG